MLRVLSYLVVFGLGCLSGYVATVSAMSPDEPQRSFKEWGTRMRRLGSLPVRWVGALRRLSEVLRRWLPLIVAIMAVVIGVQFTVYQHSSSTADKERDSHAQERDAQARCLSMWGADVVSALSARVDANDDLKAAQTRHDNALDSIIGVVIASRSTSNQAQSRKDFDAALDEFAAAKSALTRTQQTVAHTLRANPYPPAPTLTCP